MDAAGIEAIPAITLRSLAVALFEALPAIDPVMLAGNIVDLLVGPLDDLGGRVELLGLGDA